MTEKTELTKARMALAHRIRAVATAEARLLEARAAVDEMRSIIIALSPDERPDPTLQPTTVNITQTAPITRTKWDASPFSTAQVDQ